MFNRYFEDSDYFDHEVGIKLWAKRQEDHQLIQAIVATKDDGPFYCPESFDPVIVKKYANKRDHFAYWGRLSPINTTGESELHRACKYELLNLLHEAFPDGNWATERRLTGRHNKGLADRQPDLSGRFGNSKRDTAVVIEIQKSSLTIPEIVKRMVSYADWKCHVLWVIPLLRPLGIEKFRPRLFERFLHTVYYGRIYYWVIGDGLNLSPVHLDSAYRWIDEKHWFEEDGVERTASGYDKPYRTIFSPNYGKHVNIATDLFTEDRPQFIQKNERLTVPRCKIMVDHLDRWWTKD